MDWLILTQRVDTAALQPSIEVFFSGISTRGKPVCHSAVHRFVHTNLCKATERHYLSVHNGHVTIVDWGFRPWRPLGSNPWTHSIVMHENGLLSWGVNHGFRQALFMGTTDPPAPTLSMPTKRCSRCSLVKEASHFYKNVTRCNGLSPECKVCRLQVQRANQASHKLKDKEAWSHRNSTAKLAQRQQQRLSGTYSIHRERDKTSRVQKKLLQPYWELGRQKPNSAFQAISKRIPQHRSRCVLSA